MTSSSWTCLETFGAVIMLRQVRAASDERSNLSKHTPRHKRDSWDAWSRKTKYFNNAIEERRTKHQLKLQYIQCKTYGTAEAVVNIRVTKRNQLCYISPSQYTTVQQTKWHTQCFNQQFSNVWQSGVWCGMCQRNYISFIKIPNFRPCTNATWLNVLFVAVF